MHGPHGNGARKKTALMSDPLLKSSCGFTTLSRVADMDCGFLRKMGTHPQPVDLMSLDILTDLCGCS